MKLLAYQPAWAVQWDQFIAASGSPNFLFTRRFLGYHGDRFEDCSLLICDENDLPLAVFPAARAPSDSGEIISHPGLTYGGLIAQPKCKPEQLLEMTSAIAAFYKEQGARSLVWKSAPDHIFEIFHGAQEWALWRAGAAVERLDLWNMIDLRAPNYRSKGHKWAAKKAQKNGIIVAPAGPEQLGAFHHMLCENLASRHDAAPVHSHDELVLLHGLFPDQITLLSAQDEHGEMQAGTLLFHLNENCTHTQYIAATQDGRKTQVLNLLLEHAIEGAQASGKRYFSFGASTENGGEQLNAGLFAFKAGFGQSSLVQRHFRLNFQT